MRRRDLSSMTTEDLRTEIWLLQLIQKKFPPSSAAWRKASAALQPRFAEMARRMSIDETRPMPRPEFGQVQS